MRLRDRARLLVGSFLIRAGARVMGAHNVAEAAAAEVEDDEPEPGPQPFPAATLNDEARRMVAETAPGARTAPRGAVEDEKPKPLAGSRAWRAAREMEGR